MRYEGVTNIVNLAMRMQGLRAGMTLDDIRAEFAVSRRTAERMRDAVDWAFGPLEMAESDDNRRHWRLRSNALRRLAQDIGHRAGRPRGRGRHPGQPPGSESALRRCGSWTPGCGPRCTRDSPGAHRDRHRGAGPGRGARHASRSQAATRQGSARQLLREAIATCRVVELRYLSQSTGRRSRQRIEPYGLLYGNRAFLVGRTDWTGDMRLWRLANMSEPRVTGRDLYARDPEFDLEAYARRSFGTFQEEPVDVVLRFSAEAKPRCIAAFLFHPGQSIEENADGTLTVRFTAGGIDEMCWHLVTWGESVTVEEPDRLRQRLAGMCAALAAHHGPEQTAPGGCN